jgi:uncharacterized secreted protein with C-terminal beta-propeller domain
MKYDDLIKKLENLKTPEIELHSHKQALKMALLNSRHFKQRTIMNWAKVLAPITTAVLLIAVVGLVALNTPKSAAPFDPVNLGGNQINTFASYEELQEFVKRDVGDGGFPWELIWNDVALAIAPRTSGESVYRAPAVSDYSTTNIQVARVDEADIVKTDGQYIYVASGNKAIIVQAYPPEQARVLSEIKLEGTAIGIFVNGDRLVVFETPYDAYRGVLRDSVGRFYMSYVSPKTTVKVYDVSDRENPRLQRDLSADGQYVSSRMIGDYAYVVINEPVYEEEGEVNLPKLYSGNKGWEIPATDICYSSNVSDHYYMYTTIMAINVQNADENPTYATMLLGASSNLYVSMDNIYLTCPVWGGDAGDSQKTSIHRIHIDGGAMNYTATGDVPGMVLNQFSVDEYDGYFRVATTTYAPSLRNRNNVYVLDMSLNITGLLTDLAEGQRIYSARFMGDRCYLVTFKQVDPLFVIDLKDPYDPEVLGYLKVPGYSDYLHPYDETHLIGIGKETTDAGTFAWYQGVKISLFDVSDVSHPREIDKEIIGHRGSDSPVLYDHKAFLFDKSRNLMVIPILEAEVDESQYPEGVPDWAYAEPVWQGACVFHISTDAGITSAGNITHIENPSDLEQGYYYYYSFFVQRSLYISGEAGDVLYTISDAKIMMNDLENLDHIINEVELPYSTWTPYDYGRAEPGVAEPSPGAE